MRRSPAGLHVPHNVCIDDVGALGKDFLRCNLRLFHCLLELHLVDTDAGQTVRELVVDREAVELRVSDDIGSVTVVAAVGDRDPDLVKA